MSDLIMASRGYVGVSKTFRAVLLYEEIKKPHYLHIFLCENGWIRVLEYVNFPTESIPQIYDYSSPTTFIGSQILSQKQISQTLKNLQKWHNIEGKTWCAINSVTEV